MVWLNRTHYLLLKILQAKFFNFSKLSHQVKFQRITQIPRSSPTQSANYAKFAHFVNLFYIMFQAPAPAENPEKFQRIKQIPCSSPTQSANYAKFAHFVNLFYMSCGRLTPRQPLSVCALLPAYEGNRHLQPLGNLGHCLRRSRWID